MPVANQNVGATLGGAYAAGGGLSLDPGMDFKIRTDGGRGVGHV